MRGRASLTGRPVAMLVGMLLVATVVAGCSRYNVIPDSLEKQVNKDVTFEDIYNNPQAYRGQLVVLGGQVLNAELEDSNKTRLEVLNLPLDDDYLPKDERGESKGRFVAVGEGTEAVDPAVFKDEMPVSIVGEVTGEMVPVRIGDTTRDYPLVRIRDITVWDKDRWQQDGYRYAGARRPYGYWGAGYPYGHWY